MDLPGYNIHPLKGQRKDCWSIVVNGNWRITFEFEDGDAYILNYEDYHIMTIMYNPPHPGEFIKDTYIEPLDISLRMAALKLNVSASTFSRLIRWEADLSPEMALRLSKAFGELLKAGCKCELRFHTVINSSYLGQIIGNHVNIGSFND